MRRTKVLGLLFILSFTFVPIVSTQDAETIFIGFPKRKVSEAGLDRVAEELPREKAANLRCVISKIEDKYYWASRENVGMVKIEGGAFITFLAVNGSGYVRVIAPELKEAASLMSKTEKNFDYVEHLNNSTEKHYTSPVMSEATRFRQTYK